LQLNATTNPKPNAIPNPDPIFNRNPKTNPNFTPKSEDLNMVILAYLLPMCT